MNCSTPGLPVHHQLRSLPKPMSIKSVMSSSHLILSHPFSCPQSFPALGSFPMSQLFAWGGQSIGVSASISVLPMNTQDWSPLGWTGDLAIQGTLESSPTPQWVSYLTSVFNFLIFRKVIPISVFWCGLSDTKRSFVQEILKTYYVPTFLSAKDISGDQDPGLRALHFIWGGVWEGG